MTEVRAITPTLLQVVEKRCWMQLLETGQIEWKVGPREMTLAEMIATYESAHQLLAPRIHSLDDQAWEKRSAWFIIDGKTLLETSFGHMFWLGLFDAIHHRGQLSVYIRPMGGKVPAIYGPSGDEGMTTDPHQPLLR